MKQIKIFLFMLLIVSLNYCQLSVTSTDTPPTIDGILNDTCWTTAATLPAFKDFVGTVVDAKIQTEVKITYDANNLYVGIKCLEPNTANIIANETAYDSDKVYADDSIEIHIDTDNMQYSHASFFFNTKETRSDKSCSGSTSDEVNFNPNWTVKVVITEKQYWIAEVKIPFAEFNKNPHQWANAVVSPPKKDTIWGMNVCRNIKTITPGVSCSWAGIEDFHSEAQFESIKFTSDVALISNTSWGMMKSRFK